MDGRNLVPLAIHHLHTPQQEPAQAPGFFEQIIHRLNDHFALGVNRLTLLASEIGAIRDFTLASLSIGPSFGGSV